MFSDRLRRSARLCVELLDDRIVPTAMLIIDDVYMSEGSGGSRNAVVTVRLTEPHGNSVTVDYTTADGHAVAGSDYTPVSGRLTFARDELSKSIVVPVVGDRLPENSEYFYVKLSNGKGAKISDGSGYISISDDEPQVSITGGRATEGDSGTTPVAYTVSLSGGYDLPVAVSYATANGTATAGVDYVAQTGTITFNPGETTKTINVLLAGDEAPEWNESVLVNLSTSDSYAQLSQSVGYGTIVDDEPRIIVSDAYLDDSGSTITFTVNLAAPSSETVSVDFTTVDGSAVAGVDYVARSGTITFNPGETTKTITIDLLAFDYYSYEYLALHFGNVSANALLTNEWTYGYLYGYEPNWGDWGGIPA